jgi:hypothetical protein
MATIKLHDKDFTLQLRNGETPSLSAAKRTTIIGELLFCHDTGQLYIAQTTAGASDSVLFQIPAVSGTDSGHAYTASGTIDTATSQTITVKNGLITDIS